jgi:formate-dependent nitrite reductase membrane component NrfD
VSRERARATARFRATLERTAHQASLVEEYLSGRAAEILKNRWPSESDGASYYELPAIKKPTWEWYVPAYLFVGGVSSGAYITATLADIVGTAEDGPVVRAGRLVALAGMMLSPALLIADLGRPGRFLNMLRVFKLQSIMNLGSWALAIFGLFTGLAVGVEAATSLGGRVPAMRLLVRPFRVLSWLGLLPAMFVGSYTGLLLSTTNVPLWARNRLLLGPLFFSSAMSTGLAASTLGASLFGWNRRHGQARFARAQDLMLVAELGLTAASALQLRGLARPLARGPGAMLNQLGVLVLGLLVPIALGRPSRRNPRVGALRSALVLLGGALMRFAVVEAGKASADDPHAYFAYTSSRRAP